MNVPDPNDRTDRLLAFDVDRADVQLDLGARGAERRSHSVDTSWKRICLWLADHVAKARMNASLISLQSTNR